MKTKSQFNSNLECTKCGKVLNPKTAVWLELDTRDGEYYFTDHNHQIPEEFSQGGFVFGSDCAANVGRRVAK